MSPLCSPIHSNRRDWYSDKESLLKIEDGVSRTAKFPKFPSRLVIGVEVSMILTLVGLSYGTLHGTARRARGVGADNFGISRRSSLLLRSREVASIGGGRTATYKNGIVSRLDNPLNLGVVERKFSEA